PPNGADSSLSPPYFPQSPTLSLPSETSNDNSVTSSLLLNRQTSNDDSNQQSKRKCSLSQYNERKRLKNEILSPPTTPTTPQSSTNTDTDLRLNGRKPLSPDKLRDKESIPFYADTLLQSNFKNNDQSKSPMRMDDEKIIEDGFATEKMFVNDERPSLLPQSQAIDITPLSPVKDENVRTTDDTQSSKDTVYKSNLSEPGVKKIMKKKVVWADEKSYALVQTSYYELEDSEMVHMIARGMDKNISISQLEKLMERDLKRRIGAGQVVSPYGLGELNDDNDKPPLNLKRIIIPETIPQITINSQERLIQDNREKTVLQAIFISRLFLPESATEPDFEICERNEPKIIPFDDVNTLAHNQTLSNANILTTNVSSTTNNSITTPYDPVADILRNAYSNVHGHLAPPSTVSNTSSTASILPSTTIKANDDFCNTLNSILAQQKVLNLAQTPTVPSIIPTTIRK
ncbi:unnamed protein product, partial [Didymodactylos carnosus]